MNGKSLKSIFKNTTPKLISLLFPPKCVICNSLLISNGELCDECLEIWEKARKSRCPVCKKTARACTCRTFHLPTTDTLSDRNTVALAFYAPFGEKEKKDILIRQLIYRVKTAGDRTAVRFVCRQLSAEILKILMKAGEKREDWKITYPPRSRKRIRRYGFDHGKLLAASLSRYTGIPLEKCIENKGRSPQKALNSLQRKENATRSYSLKKDYKASGKYFIVDDVITTGATVNAIASLLKGAGAEKAYPVCIARSKKKKRTLRRMAENPWFRSK